MGSSSPHAHIHWVLLAVVCGLLYLVFDALRTFAFQLSAVRLRQLTAEEGRARWMVYDAANFQLASGALLQISLLIAAGATVMIFDEHPIGSAILFSILIWSGIAMLWKFVLGLVPDEAGEVVLRMLIPVSHFFYYAFWPVLYPLRRVAARFDREEETDDDDEEPTEEEVQAFIGVGEEEGILEASEGRMIQSVVEFGDRLAREIMTPRIDVEAFDANRSIDDLARLFSDSKYARIPIYTSSIDQITGIVHIKDLFDVILKKEEKRVEELARPPYFVSETKKVSELLRELQSEHLQVAVVVDEYGGTAGLITIEDVLEELVGDIADEHEDEEATIVDLGGDAWLVSGTLRVEELEEALDDADLEGEGYETVAGLIFTTLGRVPKVGAVVAKNGYIFDVDRADRRRIYRVKVTKDPHWKPEGEEEEE